MIHVVIPGRNCPTELEECFLSVVSQRGVDYEVLVIDDHSDDDLHREIVEWVNELPGWRGVRSPERWRCPRNLWEWIKTIEADPEDVIVLVDGDDTLSNDLVLYNVEKAYQNDPQCLLTYGSYHSEPYDPLCPNVEAYPVGVIRNRSFKDYPNVFNHLITFKVKLWNELDESDFQLPNGEWIGVAYDQCIMHPLLEMAGPLHRFIDKDLYTYRSNNPESESKVAQEETRSVGEHLAKRPVRDRRIVMKDGSLREYVDYLPQELLAASVNHGYPILLIGDHTEGMAKILEGLSPSVRGLAIGGKPSSHEEFLESYLYGGNRNFLSEPHNPSTWLKANAYLLKPSVIWIHANYSEMTSDILFHLLCRDDAGKDIIYVDAFRPLGTTYGADIEEIQRHVENIGVATNRCYTVDALIDVIRIAPGVTQ